MAGKMSKNSKVFAIFDCILVHHTTNIDISFELVIIIVCIDFFLAEPLINPSSHKT